MPVFKHVAVADMTGDSHHFKTAAELEADGWERVCYLGCDYHTPDDTDGAAHPGTSVRPKDGSRDWVWFGSALDQRMGYDWRTWEAICAVCLEMLRIAVGAHCFECGEGIGYWCSDCREAYAASMMGDYPPPTDCGCTYHNLYRVDVDGRPSCYGKAACEPVHSTTRYEPGDERPDFGARFKEAMTFE